MIPAASVAMVDSLVFWLVVSGVWFIGLAAIVYDHVMSHDKKGKRRDQ